VPSYSYHQFTFEIFAFSCLHNIVVAYSIIFDSVSINAVHLYLSVSRSIDGGPAFSNPENLDPRFPVPRFPRPVLFMVPGFPLVPAHHSQDPPFPRSGIGEG